VLGSSELGVMVGRARVHRVPGPRASVSSASVCHLNIPEILGERGGCWVVSVRFTNKRAPGA